jgi:hypothetical protein
MVSRKDKVVPCSIESLLRFATGLAAGRTVETGSKFRPKRNLADAFTRLSHSICRVHFVFHGYDSLMNGVLYRRRWIGASAHAVGT